MILMVENVATDRINCLITNIDKNFKFHITIEFFLSFVYLLT